MAEWRAPRHVRIFLASPGDVVEEREAVRTLVQRMERTPLIRRDFTLEVVSWDDPDGPVPMLATLTPQEAVARSLPRPSECDVTVVLLWGRMGTPLEERRPDGRAYVSGTEWEFEDARRAGKPILIYRRTSPLAAPANDDEQQQRQRVAEFFTQFTGPGGTLRGGITTYADVAQLVARLQTDLETLLPKLRAPEEQPVAAGWLGRPQASVRRWTRGRLLMALVSGTLLTLVAGTAFGTFTRALEQYEAPPAAYVVRYVLLTITVLVPMLLVVLTWWWLGRDQPTQAGG